MADLQLFPAFDLPDIEDKKQKTERYYPSAYFDFYTGDFRRDGANRVVAADGRDAYIQWCLKVASTERETCLAYSSDIGVELENIQDNAAQAESDIEKTITDALKINPATEYVKDFEFSHTGDDLYCTFTVKGYPWVEDITLTVKV